MFDYCTNILDIDIVESISIRKDGEQVDMQPYRKQFRYDAEFPFDCLYRDTKSAQSELPDHIHDWYELAYVYSGRGTFFIDQTIYDARPGDIFLIPGNTVHRSFPVPDDPKTSTALYFGASLVHHAPLGDSFSYLHPFEQAKRRQTYRIALDEERQNLVIEALERIHAEYAGRRLGSRHAVCLHLQQLLLELSRWSPERSPAREAAAASSSAHPAWMSAALAYIDSHIAEPLGLSSLAARAAVTPAHFSRVFKKLTGMNVTDYVTAKRIIRAKELLLEPDLTVADIAERCGFDSLPHFHRKFKSLTGLTPAKYKRKG